MNKLVAKLVFEALKVLFVSVFAMLSVICIFDGLGFIPFSFILSALIVVLNATYTKYVVETRIVNNIQI